MKIPENIKAFLKLLPLKEMHGDDCFVAIVFFLTQGDKTRDVEVKNIVKHWSKVTLGKSFNSSFTTRAQGRVQPCGKGKVRVTDEGIAYIDGLLHQNRPASPRMIIFRKGNSHSFDKFLRDIFCDAKSEVNIADTFVDGSVFDHLLDEIPAGVPIRCLYGKDVGGFVVRSKRFAIQYSFTIKQSDEFHDRFLIIDGQGYIIGPSLKDAAEKKAATVVILPKSDSKPLSDLFVELWN